MERRQFLQHSLALSSLGLSSPGIARGDDFLETLMLGVEQTNGTLLDRVDVAMRNADAAFNGFYHGYGLGAREILGEPHGPLPTTPQTWPLQLATYSLRVSLLRRCQSGP